MDSFGQILCHWRKKRRYSQLNFSLNANISARHLSFLETGRAVPSRSMVIRLFNHLDIPKPEVNRALLAAGYAPIYKIRVETDRDLVPVQKAIRRLLDKHMPYPAFGVDYQWNITHVNQAAVLFMEDLGLKGKTNFLESFTEQSPSESAIVNWCEAIASFLLRVRSGLENMQEDQAILKMFNDLTAHYEKNCSGFVIDRSQAIIPIRFKLTEQTISTFSSFLNFGMVQDIVISELEVELMFPIDEESEKYFQNLMKV